MSGGLKFLNVLFSFMSIMTWPSHIIRHVSIGSHSARLNYFLACTECVGHLSSTIRLYPSECSVILKLGYLEIQSDMSWQLEVEAMGVLLPPPQADSLHTVQTETERPCSPPAYSQQCVWQWMTSLYISEFISGLFPDGRNRSPHLSLFKSLLVCNTEADRSALILAKLLEGEL